VVTTHYMDEAEQLCDRLVVMDKGRIAAEGSPAELIRRFSTREVLEVRFPLVEGQTGLEKYVDALAPVLERGAADRIEPLPDRLLLYTADGDAALAAVTATGLHPLSSLVRRSSLEDVFLRLTGRTLVD
jgi:lipooligosaccharide transport system ATP-binding protein